MSIRDLIEQKKREFFTARDTDKLELQKAALAKERKALEQKAKLRNDVKKEQQAIRDIRSQPVREKLSRLSTGFKNLAAGATRGQEAVKRLGGGGSSPFSPGGNPFSPGGSAAPSKVTAGKAKTITIKIKE